jgi:hypothetical protein
LNARRRVRGSAANCASALLARDLGRRHEFKPRHLGVNVDEIGISAPAKLMDDVHRPCGAVFTGTETTMSPSRQRMWL